MRITYSYVIRMRRELGALVGAWHQVVFFCDGGYGHCECDATIFCYPYLGQNTGER